MRLIKSTPKGKNRVYDIEVANVHNFYANGINVHNCATDGGVSVIKDDGTVVDIGVRVGTTVDFTEDNNIIIGLDYFGNGYLGPIPSADIDDTTYRTNYIWFQPQGGGNITHLGPSGQFDEVYVNRKALYSSEGLSFYNADLDGFTTSASAVAYATTSYNTGWMHGDIKGAFLADTDDTDVTGTELVTNGTFDTDTSGWTANGSTLPTLSVDTNRLKLTHNGTNGGAYQNITTVVGETYVISADLTNGNASSIRLRAYGDGSTGDGFQGTNYIGDSITSTSATSTSLTLVAETTTTRIYIEILGTSAEYAFADNVVARIADPDRSVNNNGLQVFGTITKSAVA